MKPENREEWEEVSTPDPDMVLVCCATIERNLDGDWYQQGPYNGPTWPTARAAVLAVMRQARQDYPNISLWVTQAKDFRLPGFRELPPDPQLAALLEEEEKIAVVVVWFDIYVRDGCGVGVGVCQNSILVRDRPPPPKVEEFPADGLQPLPRPRYAWLFSLVDRVVGQAFIALFFACSTAAGAGLYRGDGSAAAWIVLAVAVDLLNRELRNLLSRMAFPND